MSGWILSDERITKYNTLPYDFENGIAIVEKILSESGVNNVSSYRYYPKPSDVGKTIIFTFSEGTYSGTEIVSGGPGMPIIEEYIYPNPQRTKYMSFRHVIEQHNYYIQYNFDRQSTLQVTIDGVSVVEKDRLHLLGGTELQIIDDELKTVRVPYHYYTDGNDIWKSVSDLSNGWNIFGNLDHKRTPAFFFKGDSSGSNLFNAVELYQANTNDGLPKIYRRLDMHDYDPGYVPNPGEYYVWQLQYTALSNLIGFDLSVVIYNDYIYLLGNRDEGGYVRSSIIKVSRDLDNTKEQAVYTDQTPYGTIGSYSIVYNGAIHNFGGDRWGDSHYKWDGSNYTYVSTLPHGGITGVTVYQDELYALFSEDEGQLYKFNGSTWDKVTTAANFISSTKSVLITADSNINVLGGMATGKERARWNPIDRIWYPSGKEVLGVIKNGWVNAITGWKYVYSMVGDREIYEGKKYIRTPKKIFNGWVKVNNEWKKILNPILNTTWNSTNIPSANLSAGQKFIIKDNTPYIFGSWGTKTGDDPSSFSFTNRYTEVTSVVDITTTVYNGKSYKWNKDLNDWFAIATCPIRYIQHVVYYRNEFHVFGKDYSNAFFTKHYIYNESNNTWTLNSKFSNYYFDLEDADVLVHKNKIYVLGGGNNRYKNYTNPSPQLYGMPYSRYFGGDHLHIYDRNEWTERPLLTGHNYYNEESGSYKENILWMHYYVYTPHSAFIDPKTNELTFIFRSNIINNTSPRSYWLYIASIERAFPNVKGLDVSPNDNQNDSYFWNNNSWAQYTTTPGGGGAMSTYKYESFMIVTYIGKVFVLSFNANITHAYELNINFNKDPDRIDDITKTQINDLMIPASAWDKLSVIKSDGNLRFIFLDTDYSPTSANPEKYLSFDLEHL